MADASAVTDAAATEQSTNLAYTLVVLLILGILLVLAGVWLYFHNHPPTIVPLPYAPLAQVR